MSSSVLDIAAVSSFDDESRSRDDGDDIGSFSSLITLESVLSVIGWDAFGTDIASSDGGDVVLSSVEVEEISGALSLVEPLPVLCGFPRPLPLPLPVPLPRGRGGLGLVDPRPLSDVDRERDSSDDTVSDERVSETGFGDNRCGDRTPRPLPLPLGIEDVFLG